jgi:molybdate/tungstate transport system substrate-binding protein
VTLKLFPIFHSKFLLEFQSMTQKRIPLFLLALLTLIQVSSAGCTPREKTPLVIFAAGSLIIPFDALEKAFEAENPEIDVRMEYHGSIQVIRHASELNEPIDIVATADHNLIPPLMYGLINPDSGLPYANWYLKFATNRLVLAYTEKSKYSTEINPENWYEILSRDDVIIGLPDPRFDAAGYRTLMLLKLAEDHYDVDNIFGHVFGGQFQTPMRASTEGELTIIKVPEILETKPGARIVLRGSSVMLISLMDLGEIDYVFEYESVTRQHGFQMIELPSQIDFSSLEFVNLYASTQVHMDFQRFASITPEFQGDQIIYGITIPSQSSHPAEAERFIAFLLSEEGKKIMEENYHPIFDVPVADHFENLPESLKSLVISGN